MAVVADYLPRDVETRTEDWLTAKQGDAIGETGPRRIIATGHMEPRPRRRNRASVTRPPHPSQGGVRTIPTSTYLILPRVSWIAHTIQISRPAGAGSRVTSLA